MMRVNEVLDTVDDGGAWQLIALSQVRLNVVCELLGQHRPHQAAQGNRDVPPSAEKQKDRDRNASGRRGRRRKRRPRSSEYRADDTQCGQTWDNAISCGNLAVASPLSQRFFYETVCSRVSKSCHRTTKEHHNTLHRLELCFR